MFEIWVLVMVGSLPIASLTLGSAFFASLAARTIAALTILVPCRASCQREYRRAAWRSGVLVGLCGRWVRCLRLVARWLIVCDVPACRSGRTCPLPPTCARRARCAGVIRELPMRATTSLSQFFTSRPASAYPAFIVFVPRDRARQREIRPCLGSAEGSLMPPPRY